MNAIRALLAALLMLAATPAWADTTALYKSPKLGAEMRVEVASNGNMRSTAGANGTYHLTLDGENYIVFYSDKGAVVDRMSDVAAVMTDYMHKLMPDFRPPPADEKPLFTFVQSGQMTVQGRPGTVWYMAIDGQTLAPMSKIVISADPALAELGRAFVRQFEVSTLMVGGVFGGGRNPWAAVLDVLKTGAPLLINDMELGEVTHTPIPAERFVLPATPETREQVRVRFEASGGHIP